MRKYIFPILISLLLFYPSQGFAETKEIIAEGTYNMGDGETPSVAESRALLQAKRTALEQAGTYVESYSKVINLQLTEDEIQVLASGLMEVEILDKKRTVVGDGFHFWVKIKVRVNLDKTEELANRIKAKDRTFVEDYKKIQEAYDKSQKEIEELKKQLSEAKEEKEKKQVEARITDDEMLFQANEWLEKGVRYHYGKKYDEAIEAYTSAITLTPNFSKAYRNRGFSYFLIRKYDKAISDLSKALTLNSQDAPTYNVRGFAYIEIGEYDLSIADLNKGIALEPNEDGVPYTYRGIAYQDLGNINKAIPDFQKACDLGDKDGCNYLQRSLKTGSEK